MSGPRGNLLAPNLHHLMAMPQVLQGRLSDGLAKGNFCLRHLMGKINLEGPPLQQFAAWKGLNIDSVSTNYVLHKAFSSIKWRVYVQGADMQEPAFRNLYVEEQKTKHSW